MSYWTGYTQRELPELQQGWATIRDPRKSLRTTLVELALNGYRTLFLGKTGIGINQQAQSTDNHRHYNDVDSTNGNFLKALGLFLEARAKDNQKFAATFCPVAPHYPCWHLPGPPPKGYERPEYRDAHRFIHESGHQTTWGPEQIADHYASAENMDAWLGGAVDLLGKHGVLDDTLIIVTADHGAGLDESKGHNRLAGVQQPMIFAGPEVARTGLDPALVMHVDVFWTVREFAGLSAPFRNEEGEGQSLVPLLRNPAKAPRRRYTMINRGPGQDIGVRDAEWSYYENATGRALRMFRLSDENTGGPGDILEEKNVLATEPANLRKRLSDVIAYWKKHGRVDSMAQAASAS